MILEVLQDFDRQLLLAVNGSDSLYLDRVVRTLTHGATWIPLYLSMFYLVLKNNDNFRRLLFLLGGVALCYLLSGAIDDGIVKPLVPCGSLASNPRSTDWYTCRRCRWLSWRQLRILFSSCLQHHEHSYLFLLDCAQSQVLYHACNMVACKLLDPSLSWCPFPWRHPCWSHLGCNRRHWRLFPLQSINPWHVYAS